MSKLFLVRIGYQTTAPRGSLDLYGIDSELFVGNSGDQVAYLGNSVRLNLGNILLSKNLAGVAGSDNYKHIETSTNTGYAALELGYAGNIKLFATNGATTANSEFSTPVTRLFIEGSTGNIGIGTLSPTVRLTVNGSSSILGGLNMNSNLIINVGNAVSNGDAVNLGQMNTALGSKISGSGTANYIPVFSNSNSISNSNIYYDGTNIGIGIISGLAAKLHVVGTALISGGLNVNSQKITNVAAGTNSGDAVNFGQISGLGSKWTLSGSDIYRLSNVFIGSGTPFYTAKINTNGDILQSNGVSHSFRDTSGTKVDVLKYNTSNHLELNSQNDTYLTSGGVTRLKIWGSSTGAVSIGSMPFSLQHALHVESDTVGNLWTARFVFRTNKNNNFQVGESGNTLFAINNAVNAYSVDLGNKIALCETKVLFNFTSYRESRKIFDGNQFGTNIVTNRIMHRTTACISTAATSTQTNCNIEFDTNTTNSANHKFIVEIDGSISGTHFKYFGIVSYASGTATIAATTALNSITNCTVAVSVVSSKIVVTITKTSGNFTYTNLIIKTQATGYSNGADQAAPSVSNVTFS